MKSKSSTGPSKYAKPYITNAANQLQSATAANAPTVAANSAAINNLIPGLAERAGTQSPLLGAANTYATDVLSGRYLDEGNPYLEGIIGTTNQNVRDQVNSTFSRAGRTAGAQHEGLLTRELANSENNLRFQNYGNERNAMQQSAALAPGLEQAGYTGLGALLNAAQLGSTLPLTNAQSLASGMSGLMGGYRTTTQTPSLFDSIQNIAGLGLSLAGGLPFGGK